MKQFKDFITEARQMPEFEAIRAQFNGVVIDGLTMVIRGQITHWTVKNYATHEALGEFYETLKEQLDHLVESGIAVGFSTVLALRACQQLRIFLSQFRKPLTR